MMKFVVQGHTVLKLLFSRPPLHACVLALKVRTIVCLESCAREKCKTQVILPYLIKNTRLPDICPLYLCEQVNFVVCLSKVIKYVIVLCGDTQCSESIFESSRLFKQAKYSFNLHIRSLPCPGKTDHQGHVCGL